MPSQSTTLYPNVTYSLREYKRMKRGFVPQDMDHKWFIFFEGDVGFFHRSWTGRCIFEATFRLIGDAAILESIQVNRDPKQWKRHDNEEEIEMVCRLIDYLLLGKNLPPFDR